MKAPGEKENRNKRRMTDLPALRMHLFTTPTVLLWTSWLLYLWCSAGVAGAGRCVWPPYCGGMHLSCLCISLTCTGHSDKASGVAGDGWRHATSSAAPASATAHLSLHPPHALH